MDKTATILKRSGLSVTEGRRKILDLFLEEEGALAHSDIERNTDAAFDRVTVYRTLQSFVEKGIVHQIPTTDNSVLYALCRHECDEQHLHDDHVHFLCNNCNKTICLDEVTVPAVKLPSGFRVQQRQMIVKGICSDCR